MRAHQRTPLFKAVLGAFVLATRFLPRRLMRLSAHVICVPFILFNMGNFRAVVGNMAVILPTRNRAYQVLMAYRVFLKYSFYLIDLFYISHGRERLKGCRFRHEGAEHLQEALRSEKGVILLTLHMGNWEVGGLALAELGFRTPVIAYNPDSESTLESRRLMLRRMYSIDDVMLGSSDLSSLKLFRILTGGGMIAIQGDRLQNETGISLEMFAHPAMFPKGPVVLSAASGALILPVFITMGKGFSYTIHVEKPLSAKVYSGRDETVRETMKEIIPLFAKYISRYPDQWYTFMPFWSTTPGRSTHETEAPIS